MDELGRPRRGGGVGEWGDDTGAALVELAMVLVLLVMLLVGTVTAAVAYGRGNSIQNAAREASRFGATLPNPGNASWLTDIRTVAQAAATGDLDPSVPGYYLCVAYVDSTGPPIILSEGAGTPYSATQCYDDGRPPEEKRVQVVVGRETTVNAIIFSTDIDLQAEAAARYER